MNVERFWCSREGTYPLDEHGFLRDPDLTGLHSHSVSPGVVRVDVLRSARCLVLLGEPGVGKSTAVSNAAQLVASGVPVLLIDLASYGSEDRLVREVFDDHRVTDWAAGTGDLCIVFDSLDEAQARIPYVGRHRWAVAVRSPLLAYCMSHSQDVV